jgi:hypothetical protein
MSRPVSMDAGAITARLREVSARADLRPEHRLDAKIGLDAASITARLKLASALRDLCVRLARR